MTKMYHKRFLAAQNQSEEGCNCLATVGGAGRDEGPGPIGDHRPAVRTLGMGLAFSNHPTLPSITAHMSQHKRNLRLPMFVTNFLHCSPSLGRIQASGNPEFGGSGCV